MCSVKSHALRTRFAGRSELPLGVLSKSALTVQCCCQFELVPKGTQKSYTVTRKGVQRKSLLSRVSLVENENKTNGVYYCVCFLWQQNGNKNNRVLKLLATAERVIGVSRGV